MSETFEDFIYINDNVLDENSCKEITENITKSDIMKNNNSYLGGHDADISSFDNRLHIKDDFSFVFHTHFLIENHWRVIYKIVKDGYEKYLSKWFNVVEEKNSAYCPVMKYHIVQQHQGYHGWHYEWAGAEYPANNIVLVWHLSLTSHKNEGELEFKYYDKRIEPKAGRLLVWPGGFTHTHRGNVIRSDTQKHYITGWWFAGNKR